MKKSLIALAVLAAAGAASAQSSVTLSGSLAAGYNYSSAGVSKISRHGAADNNITLRGTEDLGGGLTAGFLINQRFNPDTGLLSRSAQEVPRVGRNDPCPCGSGLKYKACHG